MNILSTYRIQFHRGFTFADAERIVPYLADLGVSHLYASPITVAQPGSTHGYDVVDPTRVNPELGGEEGLRSLVSALRSADMGLVIDIVPNHMGIAGGNNPWWQDVLEKGQASPYARFFDIDWREPLLLPFLGTPLPQAIANADLKIEERGGRFAVIAYGATPYPVREEDQAGIRAEGPGAFTGDRLAGLIYRQHWRLDWWRVGNDRLNWRRFFAITELAGLRQEDDAVFEETHRLVFRLAQEGLIDGVRIDHVDGLTDPAAYCHTLRARLGPQMYIIVEKILGAGEALQADWGVNGTTGYDFMEEVSALLHDPAGEKPLTDFWSRAAKRMRSFEPEERLSRRQMLHWEFSGQLRACLDAFRALADSAEETRHFTRGMIERAVEALLIAKPVYRTYGTGSEAPPSDEKVREETRAAAQEVAAPGEMIVVDALLAWLAGAGPGDPALAAEAVRRFQQLSAPIAAKAVEDTAFYRYARLLSRNDVGFDAARFAMPAEEFQERMGSRARDWPRAMLATATHDHKRGEDVRARLAVLSEIAEEWTGHAGRWLDALGDGAVARDDIYQLLQTVVGAWPDGLTPSDAAGLGAFAERVAAWQTKALREAKLRSSWTEPDQGYEAAALALTARLLDPSRSAELLQEIGAFVDRIAPAAHANGLVQTFLRCTAPGVPDLYQGCEYADLSLVDPDNRRPVDFDARRTSLPPLRAFAEGPGVARPSAPKKGHPQPLQQGLEGSGSYDARKQALIAALLRLRAQGPDLFVGASWEPVRAEGERAGHVVAFLRRSGGRALLGSAAIRCAAGVIGTGRLVPAPDWWGDTRLILTDEIAGWTSWDLLGGAGELFGDLPVRLRLLAAP